MSYIILVLSKGVVHLMNGVSQDSEALRQDANYINEMAETFKSQYEQLFQEINANKEDEILYENEDSKTSTTSTSSVESWLKEMGINS